MGQEAPYFRSFRRRSGFSTMPDRIHVPDDAPFTPERHDWLNRFFNQMLPDTTGRRSVIRGMSTRDSGKFSVCEEVFLFFLPVSVGSQLAQTSV